MTRYIRKKPLLLTLAFLLLPFCGLFAQEQQDTTVLYTDAYLDTVKVSNYFQLNDYLMIGVEYGATYAQQIFNPVYNQSPFITPGYMGVTVTKYSKMFGYLPYFGLQVGLFKGTEGYRLKKREGDDYTPTIDGASQVIIQVLEVPMLAQMHYDMEHFKLMASAGLYGGYRQSIERIGKDVVEEERRVFLDTERRIDYGLQGGIGFGLVFSPVELHVNGRVRYSWSSLFQPDAYSPYYYRYAYPFDFMLTVGLHMHLSLRNGRSRQELKREARTIVYGQ